MAVAVGAELPSSTWLSSSVNDPLQPSNNSAVVSSFYNHANFSAVTKPQSNFLWHNRSIDRQTWGGMAVQCRDGYAFYSGRRLSRVPSLLTDRPTGGNENGGWTRTSTNKLPPRLYEVHATSNKICPSNLFPCNEQHARGPQRPQLKHASNRRSTDANEIRQARGTSSNLGSRLDCITTQPLRLMSVRTCKRRKHLG